VLVPVPPGGGLDASARLMTDSIKEVAGTVVIENRPGAALRLAIEAVKRADPDGATLLFSPISPFTIYPHIYKKLAYDYTTDFVCVSPFCMVDFALGVPGSSPINTVAEYIAAVRADPKRYASYAVPAAGAAPHFTGAQFARITGLPLEHVPYKGSAPAMQDLIGANVPAAFNLSGEFLQYLPAKRMKVLATSGERRSPFLPDVPTFAELGYRDMVLSEWFGLFAPAQAPVQVLEPLSAAIGKALQRPDVQSRLSGLGYVPFALDMRSASRRLAEDAATWGRIVKATGFTVQE
jgi:tripartite-type tricarboxylate transporter receptor subunit TctC